MELLHQYHGPWTAIKVFNCAMEKISQLWYTVPVKYLAQYKSQMM